MTGTRAGGLLVALLLATGCVASPGGSASPGGVELSAAPGELAPAPGAVTRPPVAERDVLHLLGRIGYGPRPGDVERVRAVGIARYVERQLAAAGPLPAEAEVRAALSPLGTLAKGIPELLREFPPPDRATLERLASGTMDLAAYRALVPPERRPGRIVAELQAARAVRAVASERQLEEVLVDFWLNHFSVNAGKGPVRWYVASFEREAVRPHALGRFPDLLRATARHPAMLYYLDNWLSARPGFVIPVGPNRGRAAGLNENYARELLELHTLGVDGGYGQQDVREVARAFTGWTIAEPRTSGRFVFRPAMHDPDAKVVLGERITDGGERDGERVLDLLARHPATARRVATRLVRRFVADEPPPVLVARVAATFRATDGDVRAMMRELLASREFWDESVRGAKIKKPFELVVSAVRAVGGQVDARGGLELARASARIGEGLYQAPAPSGHADRAEAWVSAGALLARMNFALALAEGRIPGVRADVRGLAGDAEPREPAAVLERLLAALLPQGATPQTRAVLARQLAEPPLARRRAGDHGTADTDVEKLVALVLGSPEFQRR